MLRQTNCSDFPLRSQKWKAPSSGSIIRKATASSGVVTVQMYLTDEDDAVDFPTINDSIPSCLDFVNATSHLWNIWTIENNGDKSVENVQRDEIAIEDFVRWYRYTGHRELLESGERCAVGMRLKYGKLQGWRARTYVAEAQQQHADFFMREMANEYGEENLFRDETQGNNY